MEILSYQDLLTKAENVTLQGICEGKLKIVSRGLTKVTIDETLKLQIAKDVSNVLGGRHSTKKVIVDKITSEDSNTLYHENLKDVVLKRENNNSVWRLTARGDYKQLKQDIRDYFNRL